MDHDGTPEATEDASDEVNVGGDVPARVAAGKVDVEPRPSWWLLAAVVAMLAVIVWVAVATPGVDVVEDTTTTTTTSTPAGDGAVEDGSAAEGARRATPTSTPLRFELSSACTEAARPLRELAASTPSGLGLTGAQADRFTEALAAAQEACDAAEYERLVDGELSGWLLAPTDGPAEPPAGG